MKLSKASTQAACAVAYLATRPTGETTQARHVAEYLDTPTDSMLKVLQALVRGGLVSSRLGRSGGYELKRPAESITLLELIETIDGPLQTALPVEHDRPELATCLDHLRAACDLANERLRHELERCTVADLATNLLPPIAQAG